MKEIKALFACGGSAGHINPALAAAEALKSLRGSCDIMFVTPGRAIEKKLIGASGFPVADIPSFGVTRSLAPRGIKLNIKAFRVNRKAIADTRRLLASYKPDIVIGTGGFACYYALREAASESIKTVIHAADAVPGLAVKKLIKKVDRIYTPFPQSVVYYSAGRDVRVSPTPVRKGFSVYSRETARRELNLRQDEKLVVSYFGSLGAVKLNDKIKELIEINAQEKSFRLIHAVGGNEERYTEFNKNLRHGSEADIRRYIDDMPRVMAAADLIICRAGASTLAEITTVGRASILIPSPFVPNDHQTKNALAMENAGASIRIKEDETTGKSLFELITETINGSKTHNMEATARSLGSADSAEKLAIEIMEML